MMLGFENLEWKYKLWVGQYSNRCIFIYKNADFSFNYVRMVTGFVIKNDAQLRSYFVAPDNKNKNDNVYSLLIKELTELKIAL
ncbi:MAG TPA: hypothetical protein VH796_01045 [Nitrososphaeraceae archaeon]|jgi:hypothetical protein